MHRPHILAFVAHQKADQSFFALQQLTQTTRGQGRRVNQVGVFRKTGGDVFFKRRALSAQLVDGTAQLGYGFGVLLGGRQGQHIA